MNTPRILLFLGLAATLAAALPVRLTAADAPELAEAKRRLVEAFESGYTDNDNQVKQLRAKIAALEYVSAAKMVAAGDSPKTITIDFPGGPASALIAAVAKLDRENGFNVIGEKSDLAIELPPFAVRNADPSALAAALNGVLQARGYTLAPNGRVAPGHSPVFTLRKLSPFEVDHRLMGEMQSFQLAPYLGQQSVDDIIGAIRTAWELDPTRAPTALRLKFHPPTGILLVSAPRDGIAIVMTVLKELRRSETPPPKAASSEKK
jgi:hypothetical protein